MRVSSESLESVKPVLARENVVESLMESESESCNP